jgi:NAD/NADP transhydrogenase beta subunit
LVVSRDLRKVRPRHSKLWMGHTEESSAEDVALRMAYAERVVIVPGYGLAVARAQHTARELSDLIEKRGGDVKYRWFSA